MTPGLSDLFIALIGAGGLGGAYGLMQLINGLRGGKLEREEKLIDRLNEDNKRQNVRADEAEKRAAMKTQQRNVAWAQATRFYNKLIVKDIDPGESLVKFDD